MVLEMEKNTPLTEALFYILLSVRHPNHGYGIIQEVEEMTAGRVVLGAGSEDTESRKKKEYLITEQGKSVFKEEKKRLEELLENAKHMDENVD